MAKVFFDTNYLIHFKEISSLSIVDNFDKHNLCASTLSCHIYCYVNKIKVPDNVTSEIFKLFSLVNFTREILYKALIGPTEDLEDNIQLHSAAEADCEYFLTSDEKLLNMKFFGKTRISKDL
ncbi:hypothetical protein A3D00_04545 [Candidatus Woesebacteria bacterium RIFCSPHIGHO2_02_FULL_38_9]|uniref:PIN domain-containing protein n=1 Tax=Candidatus Woesebacteria bacterium RIFCSPHIGHO2_01_FULL_39_28 TaxID=1802496 RepID=A0A1F7YL06_9BACT|nr:MAG: hypothetical protein A2627_00365 [Candidatus Woesebacteria bacterium RIFCSPHIGHO2_01_FULL_39_28]OGM31896.1 MAG: hypothetical protein A3D00_04545 [Candidatus Woesebacteria bacterium RIFCSPHIGHO2_02_FULL_38_9]OGM56734.1 MAG: hypothetical protein A3A50_05255 [Candidatus Woesebacteria bacterium RIFCSPLOWO2_01_FULL_38_20]